MRLLVQSPGKTFARSNSASSLIMSVYVAGAVDCLILHPNTSNAQALESRTGFVCLQTVSNMGDVTIPLFHAFKTPFTSSNARMGLLLSSSTKIAVLPLHFFVRHFCTIKSVHMVQTLRDIVRFSGQLIPAQPTATLNLHGPSIIIPGSISTSTISGHILHE